MLNIFQSPWLLIMAAVVVFVVIIVYRRDRPDRWRSWQLPLPFVVATAGIFINHLVVTDYEKIEALINVATQAVIYENIDQLASTISINYFDQVHDSKAELMSYCRGLLSKPLVQEAKQQYNTITISAPNAESELQVRVHLERQGYYGESMLFVKMKIHFTRTGEANWFISSTELLAINNQPVSWRDVR